MYIFKFFTVALVCFMALLLLINRLFYLFRLPISRRMELQKSSTSVLVVLFFITVPVYSGIYEKMAKAMLHHMMHGLSDGWDSKGVTFGLKSKGMTAVIPIPFPIPLFSRDKGGGGGGGGGKVKYIPVP